jgi:hypothetical protein
MLESPLLGFRFPTFGKFPDADYFFLDGVAKSQNVGLDSFTERRTPAVSMS